MLIKEWIRDALIDNDFDRKAVRDLYEEAKRETGADCSKESFGKYVWLVSNNMDEEENESTPESIKETYSDYDADFLINIIEEEVERRQEKLSSRDLKLISESRGIPYGAFFYHIKDVAGTLKNIYQSHLLHIKDDVEKEGYKQKLALLKKENTHLKKEESRFQLFLEAVENITEEYKPFKPPIFNLSKKNNIIAQALISDAHWGEEVSFEELQGLNEYNTEIAKERLDKLFEGIIDYCKTLDIRTIDINLLGDNISGRIHQELIEHTADPVVFTVLQFSDYLSQWIRELTRHVKVRKVRCVPGNHGRFDIKPGFKNKSYNNHEFYLAKFIEKETKNLVEEFVIPPSLVYIDQVFETGLAWLHGDIFRGGTGLNPVSGTWGRDVAKLNALYNRTKLGFDIINFGHFHTGDQLIPSFDGTKIVVNGSLKGTDEFSISVVKAGSRPNQTIYSIEKGKKGELKYFQTIFLD